MPIFCYECIYCKFEFEEFHKTSNNSGKTFCLRCGNSAFKIPAPFNTGIFKKRQFADGTSTPNFVNTPKQEKVWLKSEGITYDKPTGKEKNRRKQERKIKSKTAMELAFKDASEKVEQGYKIEGLDKIKQKGVKKNAIR